jgi:uncharacterized protein YbjQ (UPF0145 family)
VLSTVVASDGKDREMICLPLKNQMKTIKFLLFIAIVSFLSGCQVSYPAITYSTFIDYSFYTKKRFFMSESSSVNFDYNPVGSVAGVSRIIGSSPGSIALNQNSASVEDALDAAYEEAVKQGANGIINLTYDYTFSPDGYIARVVVKGMAIKRKQSLVPNLQQ